MRGRGRLGLTEEKHPPVLGVSNVSGSLARLINLSSKHSMFASGLEVLGAVGDNELASDLHLTCFLETSLDV